MVFRARRLLVSGAIGVTLAWSGLAWAASADSLTSPSATTAVTADTPPPAVEDFSYPNADAVLSEEGIQLKKGDGHILLADCDATADQIRVLTVADAEATRQGTYCFVASGATGYLTMQLPRVFALEAADHPISADLTASGKTTTVDVAEDGFEPVGEGSVGGVQSVLVEIRVTG
ncbi:hypothetical protein [Streptomyces sp. NPDC060184]|uniref:hypothetical protein n=1 Tax=Streptomyces sp. NPDC060184 TaxID=3347064 RepID=UPI003651AF96